VNEVEPPVDRWSGYLAAARRLDVVRCGVATSGGADGELARTAVGELAAVRHRLAGQRDQLIAAGVPAGHLEPTCAEVAQRARSMAAGPAGALTALRQAHEAADRVDTLLSVRTDPAASAHPLWLRNLLVYGPFATIVLVIQLALFMAAGDNAPISYVLSCGLVMPPAAFGLGWLAVGLAFRGAPGERVDRTPLVGAATCAAPLALTCLLSVVLSLTR